MSRQWEELAALCEEGSALLADANEQKFIGLGLSIQFVDRLDLACLRAGVETRIIEYILDVYSLMPAEKRDFYERAVTVNEKTLQKEKVTATQLRDPDSAYHIHVPDAGFHATDPFGDTTGGLLWMMRGAEVVFQPLSVYEKYRADCIRFLKAWARHCQREAKGDRGAYEGPKSPGDWAKIFGVTWETIKARIDQGLIRAKKQTTKAWLIHRDDIPKGQ